MSRNIRTGHSTRLIQKMQDQMTRGLYAMENYKKHGVQPITEMGTYYLLHTGVVVTFREWYQANRPDYIVSGSKKGCESHRRRIF